MLKHPPTKVDRYTVPDVIAALQEAKGMISEAAHILNCHPNTVRGYIERHPTVAAAHREQREGFLDVAELALLKAIHAGEVSAITFALRTIGRERGYGEHIEHDVEVKSYDIIIGSATEAEKA
jgi:hypothetical protein